MNVGFPGEQDRHFSHGRLDAAGWIYRGSAAGGPLPGSPQTTFFLSFALVRGGTPYANFDTVHTADQRSGNFTKPAVAGPLVLYHPISHLPLAGNIVPASRSVLEGTREQFMESVDTAPLLIIEDLSRKWSASC